MAAGAGALAIAGVAGFEEGVLLTVPAVLGVNVLIEVRPAIRRFWRNILRPPAYGGRQTNYYRYDLSAHIRESGRCPSAVLKHSYTSLAGGVEPAAPQAHATRRLLGNAFLSRCGDHCISRYPPGGLQANTNRKLWRAGSRVSFRP